MTDEILQRDDDAQWRLDAENNWWQLPPKAAWPFRLPGIRRVRAVYHETQVHRLARQFATVGVGTGWPNPRDLWVIYAISRGWC